MRVWRLYPASAGALRDTSSPPGRGGGDLAIQRAALFFLPFPRRISSDSSRLCLHLIRPRPASADGLQGRILSPRAPDVVEVAQPSLLVRSIALPWRFREGRS